MIHEQPPARILGVDFDEPSALAVKAAATLAHAFDASLTVVHAHTVGRPAYFTGAQMDSLEAGTMAARRRCADDVTAFVAKQTSRSVTALVEEGAPPDVIARLAPGFDLVVVGTHRRQGPRRWWLGSVAEAVLRESPVPVLVIPMERNAS
jgi:nucleotide-binding universal stress UspA family protein